MSRCSTRHASRKRPQGRPDLAGVFASANGYGVAIVTMAKGGLMYEASVGGQKFSFKPTGED
jgi:hypothetical protein